jgi:ribonuclease P/MRP protein subunit POP5
MEDKTKTLPSSYREKKRYIIFELLSDEKIEFDELIKAIWSSTINLIGILGVAKTNFKFINDLYDKEKQKFVVRCLPKDVEVIRLALALITEINEKKVCIRSLGVTGTLKAAKIKFFES